MNDVDFIIKLKTQAKSLGFSGLAITSTDLSAAEAGLLQWLQSGNHGEMDYMSRYGVARARAASFVPGAVCAISVRLDYSNASTMDSAHDVLRNPEAAYISRYALGRDYHKVMRQRLQQLADWITATRGAFNYRVFSDSAPIMEVALAAKTELGWRGKHTLLLNREHGSYFFLGEIICDLALPSSPASSDHCGSCQSCISACPTGAITAPYQLDARRCISYLTIELKTAIPIEFRKAIGNRIYGCDDCQMVCPWNKFAQSAPLPDFAARNGLENAQLLTLFAWDESEFNRRLEGSPIRRIGHERWLRNIAVALGNVPPTSDIAPQVVAALQARAQHPSALLREHIAWALAQFNA